MHERFSQRDYNTERMRLKVMNIPKASGLSLVREQIRQLNSDLQAFETRQEAKPLGQSELFTQLVQLSAGQATITPAPPAGQELSQSELFAQLQAQAGRPNTAVDLAAPVAGPLQHPEQPEELSQDSLLEALRTEAKRNV